MIMPQGFFCILLLLLSFTLQAKTLTCRVVGITDGDTFSCLTTNNQQIKVRLAEIDAPEHNQPFGKKSRQRLASLIHQRHVKLAITGEDRYHRTLATVYNSQGQNVNLIMVQQGMAWAYRQYLHDVAYLQAEQTARENRRGLWRDHSPVEPHLWRQQRR
jgi:micrococcal nuclease